MNDLQHEYLTLSRYIAGLCRLMKSRKRDDIAQRPEIERRLVEARARRADLAVTITFKIQELDQ